MILCFFFALKNISELVASLSPNVGNTYDCTASGPCHKITMSQQHATEIGQRNAKVYLAMLLDNVPNALADGFIDLNELRSHANATSTTTLFQTDETGAIVTNAEGFGIPTAAGQILITQAEQYL